MLLIAVGRITHIFLLFAAIKVSTTLLSPEEMARVYLVISLFSFYSLTFLNPIGMFMNRRLHSWNTRGQVQYYYEYFWLYLIAVCGVAVVSLNLLDTVGWLGVSSGMIWLIVGLLFFSTVNQVVIPGLNMFNYRGLFIVLTLATAATSLLMSVILVMNMKLNAEEWLYGQLVGFFIFGIVGWHFFYKKLTVRGISHKLTKENFNILFHFSWPISIAVGLGWIQSQGYRFMMESDLGLLELGLFAAGYGVSAGIVGAFDSVFSTYFQPIFYKKISSDDVIAQGRAWSDYAGIFFPSLILAVFFIIAAAPQLTQVILGSKFQASSQFVMYGAIAESARIAGAVYGLIAHARMNTRLLIFPNFIGAFIAILLIWLLIPIFGAIGVGASLALASVASLGVIYISTRHEFSVKLPQKMLAMSFVMGSVAWLISELLQYLWGDSVSIYEAMIRLLVLGCIFIPFEYILLRSVIDGNYRYE